MYLWFLYIVAGGIILFLSRLNKLTVYTNTLHLNNGVRLDKYVISWYLLLTDR